MNFENTISKYPERIFIIGGGRWSKVLTEMVCSITPTKTKISVHSNYNFESITEWIIKKGLSNKVKVFATWPDFSIKESCVVIIANAARDHEKAIRWALSSKVPVLVEKPMALTSIAAKEVIEQASTQATYLATAHIFLFAGYLHNFYNIVKAAGKISQIHFFWEDPNSENRYGEKKQYDAGLPIFSDWLPHILSILGVLTPGLSQCCEKIKFSKGGADLEINLLLGDTPCIAKLVRNGNQRMRIIRVSINEKVYELDFSAEPGIIRYDSNIISGDSDWEFKERPSELMLKAFLKGASVGEVDHRLDPSIGLASCRVIDQVAILYNSQKLTWLIEKLSNHNDIDEEIRYALTEIVQSNQVVGLNELEEEIEKLRRKIVNLPKEFLLNELKIKNVIL